jgi:hypothetical protein
MLALVRTSGWVLLGGTESASVRKEIRTFIRSSTSNKRLSLFGCRVALFD